MNTELKELLEGMKSYIEDMEERVDSEWGSIRSSDELIKAGEMPDIYARVLAALANVQSEPCSQ